MTNCRYSKRNRALHRLGTASMVLLMSVPNSLNGNISLTACDAFSSPSSLIPTFQRIPDTHNTKSTIQQQQQQHQQYRGSIICSLQSQQSQDIIDLGDSYFDLSDAKLLERSRIYRKEILKMQTKNQSNAQDYDPSMELATEDLREEIKLIRNVLMERHMGLVGFIAKAYIAKVQNLTYEDLIQEGVIGLARAYEKFNPEKNTKFSTYATYWIRARILRFISERDNLVRIPEHVSRAISKINSIPSIELRNDIVSSTSQNNDEQEIRELAFQAGLTEKELKLALQVKDRRRGGGYVAFEPWMSSLSMKPSSSSHQTKERSSSMQSLEHETDRDQLKHALSKFLRPKEMEALSWRYGLLECEQEKDAKESHSFRDYEAESEDDLFGSTGILQMVDDQPVSKQPQTRIKSKIQQKGRWGEAMTFKDVGDQMAVSAEYGRRLCSQALKKLQRAAEDGHLNPTGLMS